MHASLDNHSLNWTSRELLRADAKLTDTALARQHGSSGHLTCYMLHVTYMLLPVPVPVMGKLNA